MNGEATRQTSKGVVLCRSRKQPDGKEIQGLVFDHPSMPKIVTVSSVPKKSNEKERSGLAYPAEEKRHTGKTHLVGETSPAGKKYPTGHHHHERYPTGHLTPEKFDPGYFNQRTTTIAQHYPSVQRSTGQFPLRGSPPALIHTPSRHSTEQHAIPFQPGKKNVSSPPFYSDGQPLPPTVFTTRYIQLPYTQPAANVSSRTQDATIRRNSTGTFRPHPENGVQLRQNIVQQPKNGVQYDQNIVESSQNLVQHRQNIAQHSENGIQLRQNIVPYSENGAKPRQFMRQHSMPSATDKFSRDFHLKIWRESHKRAVREWCPSAHGQDQPAYQPMTSSHNLEAFRQRSLSTGAHDRPALVHRNLVENSPHHEAHPQTIGPTLTSNPQSTIPAGKYGTNLLSTRDMRRYSTGHVRLPNSDTSTIGTYTSPEDMTHAKHTSRTRNIELRTSSTEERNPVVRSSEGTNTGCTTASSQSIEGLRSVVRNVKEPNSKESNTGEVNNSTLLAMKVADMIERRKNETRKKRRSAPTVVVISDSDDEGLEIPSPLSTDENADVFPEPSPDYRTAEGNGFVRENPHSNSSRNSDSEGACVITGVKAPGKQSVRLGSEKFGHQSIGETGRSTGRKDSYDVNNNQKNSLEVKASNYEQNREGKGTNREQNQTSMGTNREHGESKLKTSYRSVLYEREVAGRSGTQRAIMSEQLLFDKSRGLKRSLDDKSEYFVAGSAEIAGNPLRDAVRKIRRISSNASDSRADEACRSTNPKMNISTSRQSFPEMCGSVNSGERPKPMRNYEDMPKLIRSRSENDDKISKPEFKSERSRSLTYEPRPSENCITNNDFVEKCELSCKASMDDSLPLKANRVSRDELRCRKYDRELTEKPGIDISQTVVKLPKVGPKPTGIVVGVKQAPEVKQPLKQETSGSKGELKNMLKSQIIGLDHELKQLLQSRSAGSKKPAKDSGIKYIVIPEEDDVIHKAESPELGDDLDVLHISVVKKDAAFMGAKSEAHVKCSSRDAKPVSQQWETYSLKLEQGDVTKDDSCSKNPRISPDIRRNSWEEIKRALSTEEISESCNESRKRKNSCQERISCHKSYKFHDSTKLVSEQYKRQKLSEDGEVEGEFYAGQDLISAMCEKQNIVFQEVTGIRSNPIQDEKISPSQITDGDVPNVPKTTTKASMNPAKDFNSLLLVTKDSNSRIVITTADSNPPVLSPSEEIPHEMQPSVKTPNLSSEEKNLERNAHEKDPHEFWSSEKLSFGKEPQEIQPPEIGRSASPAKETQQKEELSLAEWTDILQGRIAQVKESIEEEKTPWKTKNKRKVLEKLENHYVWMTGPDVDEAFFVSRKLQFFQTMRKQYELMNKVKTQRQSMKSSDSAPQAEENVGKSKEKVVKQVEATKGVTKDATKRGPKKTKDIKKTVKCRPKR